MSPRAAVLVGGAVGTALRLAVVTAIGAAPWGTLVANVTGAAALGFLVGQARGDDRSPAVLMLGAGALGAYTTFSALAVELLAIADRHPGRATLHGLASLCLGLLAASAGVAVGDRRRPDVP